MHACLLIDEILQRIIGYAEDRETLYCLSLVCRAFHEPADDELWAVLLGLVPLVKCLPDELVGSCQEGESELTIIKPPVEDEWCRFRHHALRVKSLVVQREESGAHIDDQALEILEAHHPGPILPNLQNLVWHNWPLARFTPLFIQPTLRTLNYWPDLLASDSLPDVFRRVKVAASSLERLVFNNQMLAENGEGNHEFTHTVISLEHIREIDFDYISFHSDALAHLSKLTSLVSLSVYFTERNLDFPLRRARGTFPALETLSFTCSQQLPLLHSSSFLQTLCGSSLLRLELNLLPSSSFEDFATLLSSIGHLRRLKFLAISSRDAGGWGGTVFDGSELSPLFALSDISELTLADIPVRLRASTIGDLGAAWKALRVLSLDSVSSEHYHARLEDLALFSQHFPRLLSLTIQVYPVTEGWNHNGDVRLPYPCLSTLQLCRSVVSPAATANVALFLARTFPVAAVRHNFWALRSPWATNPARAEEDRHAADAIDRVNELKQVFSHEVLQAVSLRESGKSAESRRGGAGEARVAALS